MSDFLLTIVAFLFAISVLVSVHEFGHYWVARRLGVKVLRFSIGFGNVLWRRTGKDADKVEYSLRSGLDKSLSRKLQDVRLSAERSRMKIEDWYSHREMKASEFVRAFNKETILFQEAAAGVLKVKQYKALFGLEPGDNVILADPRIVRKAFRDK